MFSTGDILQSIASITTAASLIYVIRQARASEKTYQYTCDWQSKDKAVELTKYYKDNILGYINIISRILEFVGVVEKLSNIRDADIVDFTFDELISLTNKNIDKEIEKIMSAESSAIIISTEMVIGSMFHSDIDPFLEEQNGESVKVTKEMSIINSQKFALIVSDTLNNLEYFSMNFTSGVADESIVYPSLHQTYLRVVRVLYYYIASQNKHPKDKFYTNVIQLYHMWSKKDIENRRKAEAAIPRPKCIKK